MLRSVRPLKTPGARAFASSVSPRSNTTSEPQFSELYEDLSTRIFYGRLNSATRNIVFRPSRAKELLSRKNPIIVDGKKLEPMVYRGPPGKADLTKLLDHVTSPEQLSDVKSIIKGYGTNVAENLRPSHLVKYLRAATSLGMYSEAASVVLTGYEFKPVRNKTVMKEMLRIQAVWLGSPRLTLNNINRSKASLHHAWNKVPVKARESDLDCNLVLMYGLTGLVQKVPSDAEILSQRAQKLLESATQHAASLLATLPPAQSINAEELVGKDGSLVAYVIDLNLGAKAFETQGKTDEAAKCKEIASKLLEAGGLKGTQFLDKYVEQIEGGYKSLGSSEAEAVESV